MLRDRPSVLVVTLLTTSLLAVAARGQTTWYVDDDCSPPGSGTQGDPFCTIQVGIDAAENSDTVLVADGTYTGPGNRDLDYGGKLITVRSQSGPADCIVDCEDSGRAFYFHNNETHDTILDGFTITRGLADIGAGIYCLISSPVISNCIFVDNTAIDSGGGIFCSYSSPIIRDCAFLNNSAVIGYGFGGGIRCWHGSPLITDCIISGNAARSGGGIMPSGAGMYSTIRNCTITGNTAMELGGGMFYGYWEFYYNLLIENCVIADNVADGEGGAILTASPGLVIRNCTITGNSGGSAGGGIKFNGALSYTQIINTIMWGDDAALGPEICLDTVGTGCPSVTVAHSDIEGGEQGAWVGNCSLTWEDGNIDADPLFADPDGPDDDTGTWEDNDHHLLAGSPCIDAADNNAVPPGVTTDLDGNPRFIDDPGSPDCPYAPGTCGTPPIVDMGAHEYQPTVPTVSQWGMVVMTVLVLAAGTLVFTRRRTVM